MSEILQHLRRIVFLNDDGGLADGQLLDEFIRPREPEALAALVHRHAPMVWSVCSRTLGRTPDAEDAFQSTFLVFARKAASVTPKEMIGNWLYGVARQTALNARAAAGRRRNKERPVIDMPQPPSNDPWGELLPHLDHELGCLPHKYRAVIVLCDLEGKTRGEAAKQLRLPEGTVASQLARGRAMLAKRMARHGAKITTAGMAAFLARSAVSASTPPAIVSSTINAVVAVAGGKAAANVVSANVAALTEGVVKTMFLRQLKAVTVAFLVLLTSIAVGVTFLAAHFSEAAQKTAALPVPKVAAAPEQAAKDGRDVEPESDDEPKGEAVTVRGQVVDSAGKPRFALPGCDPEKTSEIFFVDEKDRRGVVLKLSGQDANKSHTVQLVRCGSMAARLVDEKGDPLSGVEAYVHFEIFPGASGYNWRDQEKTIDPKTGQLPIPEEPHSRLMPRVVVPREEWPNRVSLPDARSDVHAGRPFRHDRW